MSEKPTARQPARGRQRPSGCDPQDYHPPDLLLEELTQLWPQIPPHLQVCLLELARQFAS
ncbi:MAG: hypothetical protein RMJ88_13550 [Thermogemmata sp.]|nr:hypothetical protein [Thermogemmata sp.]